ncbi:MAG: DUF5803 family protein [Halanaeroarchaeum sp.]
MRRLLAIVGLIGLLVLAGCTGSAIDQQALSESATYDWNTSEAVTVTVHEERYQFVYTLTNDSTVRLSVHDQLAGTQPVSISAVKFRYENGTIVTARALRVEVVDQRTVVTLPATEGQFAYTARSGTRSLTVPVVTERSHEVILPPGMRISFPIFGTVDPGGYETELRNDRVHLTWSSVQADRIVVDYYAARDLLLYGGLVGVLLVVALLGVAYYRLQIRRLAERRSQAGLDFDEDS